MKKLAFLLAGCALLLSGCAGVKSSFDCDATTSDTCMTMTKANQLAKDKAAKQSGKPGAGGLPSLVNLPAPAPAPAPAASRLAVSSPVGTSAVVTPKPLAETTSGGLIAPLAVANKAAGSTALRPVTVAPSCQNVRCDSPGTVHPQRTQDRVATVWIAPWVDSDNAFHQPGRVSFVANPSDWVLPARVN
uniref:type IV conjugative transfer system lipoprotein TraV n=1 Tax=Serratia TaxID=613 RepID=UPI001F4BE24D|nr:MULTISPECIES: type IV conjugative transfer system lipoprotein TraV [Serratia]ULG12053.1 type IV conjugative transfer system protein TraV [Serratia entomophila]ULG12428.1 type IV conjugative transfer system protein TraV [Serratia entomophila]ULG18376.1 type IV conjugative transfer system protein TraV [Serratia proteamaculans]ULG19651.1 type IV conjugative transfer system protein TraV [Serratia proteamaculans]